MNRNSIIITVVSVIVIFGFLWLVYGLTNNAPGDTTFPQTQRLTSSDHTKWSSDKKNLLVEYSDLQCPACKGFHDVIKSQIESTQSAKTNIIKNITFVYRHFPLDQHKNAKQAAYASEAAARQGKFYEIVDLLFDNQSTWAQSKDPSEEFIKYAQQLNLNIDQFKKDSNSPDVKKKVSDDYTSGLQAQVQATPTFYLNGKKLDNIRSFDEFKKLLENTK